MALPTDLSAALNLSMEHRSVYCTTQYLHDQGSYNMRPGHTL